MRSGAQGFPSKTRKICPGFSRFREYFPRPRNFIVQVTLGARGGCSVTRGRGVKLEGLKKLYFYI